MMRSRPAKANEYFTPRVPDEKRTRERVLGPGISRVDVHYGFMEDPDVPKGLTEGDARAAGRFPRFEGDALDANLALVDAGEQSDEAEKAVPERKGVAGVEPAVSELVHRGEREIAEVDELAQILADSVGELQDELSRSPATLATA